MGHRIAIVEDHGLIAHSLATALTDRGHETHQVPLEDGDALAHRVVDVEPDLVLLDLDLGEGIDTPALIERLVEAGLQVLMVTGVADPVSQARCVAAGAIGVVAKSSTFQALVDAIEHVALTGSLLTRNAREEHLAELRTYEREERDRLARFADLTRREAEVLGELMRGRSVAQIAHRSFVSKDTVRTQVRAIRTKLGVSSQLEAITVARDAGWRPPTER